jgi:hypothetical protein
MVDLQAVVQGGRPRPFNHGPEATHSETGLLFTIAHSFCIILSFTKLTTSIYTFSRLPKML